MRIRRSHPAGVTLVELTIAIVVIGIALAGTLLVMRQTTGASADPMVLHQGIAVAEAYLEEISLKPFYDPNLGAGGGTCPAAEATRDLYDNVCDYNGLNDVGAEDQDANPIAGLERYTVDVTVDTTSTLNALTGATTVVRIDVQVSHPDMENFTLSAYRANY
jgi:MSHA pilin protein MshD